MSSPFEIRAVTGSTSSDLADRLRVGEQVSEGTWLIADRQSAGRGRMGRVWNDGAGNFMGSTMIRPHAGDPPPATLALVAGLAVHTAVTPWLSDRHRAELKWPNDLMVDGAKLAGVLLEREGDAVIVGIGVNLAQAPEVPGRETIALRTLAAAAPDRDGFAAALADALGAELAHWRAQGLGAVTARWQAVAHRPGTMLSVEDASGGRVEGAFAGLGPDGSLQLRLADGTAHVIHAGEVRYASGPQA